MSEEKSAEYYKELRNRFLPKKIKMIFIFESPPSGGGYFYNPEGKISEVLFRAMMQSVLEANPSTKEEGLKKFAEEGFVLINPIYEPVDKLPDKKADELILKNYSNFLLDLKKTIDEDYSIPIILVKANICRILETPLKKDGFNILNKGMVIPFPLHYHLPDFTTKIKSLIWK